MYLTITELLVTPGAEEDFLIAVDKALPQIATAQGCQSVRLVRSTATPDKFVLVSEWDALESHTEGFYRSDAFLAWREAVGDHLREPPRVEHALDIAVATAG
ncbi:quinol monooxygenase YgiN [Crossiella equi]|uniref:Quinol monooxygenase YgiN n=1 Tax=Crossiella equi TaxID=130796 RepID=A0ABS5AMX8_9PSEU|nr:antibiotic biosynthesis monooxygenase [Crossiella equi]MBP2477937.1 quinol monooxygenase YgiN [Crossiella equi]